MVKHAVRRRHRFVGRDRHDHTLLVLQGGGALGYQAGVYEALFEAGFAGLGDRCLHRRHQRRAHRGQSAGRRVICANSGIASRRAFR
jgi:hypothetical protein